jgi:hemolysin activation/secretion protein
VPAARLGVSGIKLMTDRQWGFGLGISHGLHWFDASDDPQNVLSSAPRAQYWKLDGSLSYTRGLPGIGVLKTNLFGQWTDHPLYFDDELTLGSPSTVRGFTNHPTPVDSGAVLRSEFAPAMPYAWLLGLPAGGADAQGGLTAGKEGTSKPDGRDKADPGFLADVLPPLQPYVFADLGLGRNIANTEDVARASVGGGVRYDYGRLNIDFSTAAPVYRWNSGDSGGDFDRSPEFYLTLSAKLF